MTSWRRWRDCTHPTMWDYTLRGPILDPERLLYPWRRGVTGRDMPNACTYNRDVGASRRARGPSANNIKLLIRFSGVESSLTNETIIFLIFLELRSTNHCIGHVKHAQIQRENRTTPQDARFCTQRGERLRRCTAEVSCNRPLRRGIVSSTA